MTSRAGELVQSADVLMPSANVLMSSAYVLTCGLVQCSKPICLITDDASFDALH